MGSVVSSTLQLDQLTLESVAEYKCNASNELAVEVWQVSDGTFIEVLCESDFCVLCYKIKQILLFNSLSSSGLFSIDASCQINNSAFQ